MKILVTGGAGFIGSHTCVELLEAGYSLVLLDNLANARQSVIDTIRRLTGKDFAFYQADLQDQAAVSRVFSEHQIDGVIHFAGKKAVGESMREPLDYYQTNLGATFVLCRCMMEAGCKTLVFSSSATVYGIKNPIPYKEQYPTDATNPYGRTKLMIEQLLWDLHAADPDWSISLLRYFNPIGAHQSGLLGENPNGIPNNLMPYITKVATGELPQLSVFGDDYDTIDGTGVRDYLHVVDLAKGHLAALRYALAHKGVEAVNLGTGKGTSVLQLVHAFEEASGRRIPTVIAPRRPGDIGEFYADTTKAEQLLGWHADKSIAEMCRDSWNFAKQSL